MAGLNRIGDVAYGEASPHQKLDVFVPTEGTGPFPLVMFVHGGAWAIGDKYDRQSRAWRKLSREGIVVASINHRPTSEAAFPACLDDCHAALRFLVDNAEKYGIDPARVAVAGDSSGAHLALMTALAGGEGVPRIGCVVAWFPPTDLVAFARGAFGDSPRGHEDSYDYMTMAALLGHELVACDDEDLFRVSPINYLPGAPLATCHSLPPILVQHGDADTMVSVEQSHAFVGAARAADPAATVEFDVLPGAEHCDRAFDEPDNMARVKAFVLEHLG